MNNIKAYKQLRNKTMTFKDLLRQFVGMFSLCASIMMLAILFIWPCKNEAGMVASLITLVTFLIWGMLGGFKRGSN